MGGNEQTTSLFLYLGMSGLERMHSQMIAWIFSKENAAMSMEAKVRLLKDVFSGEGEEEKIEGSNIERVETEDSYIDIWIKTDKELIIVENKLKTSQHSSQLERYQSEVKGVKKGEKDWNKKERKTSKVGILEKLGVDADFSVHYRFLSLMEDDGLDEGWVHVTYDRFVEALKNNSKDPGSTNSGNNFDHLSVDAYAASIERILNARDAFLDDHTVFKHVFTDGSTRKSVKNAPDFDEESKDVNPHRDVIRLGNLETVFQRLFYQKIKKEVCSRIGEKLKVGKAELPKWRVDESRGNGLFEIKDIASFESASKRFILSVQFQNGKAKIQFELEEPHGKLGLVKGMFDFYEDQVLSAQASLKNGKRRFKKLNKGTSHGYMSMSGPLFEEDKGKKWYCYSFQEIVDCMVDVVSDAKEIVEHIRGPLQEKANQIGNPD